MSVTICKRCIKNKRHSRSYQDCIKVFELAVTILFACSAAILFILSTELSRKSFRQIYIFDKHLQIFISVFIISLRCIVFRAINNKNFFILNMKCLLCAIHPTKKSSRYNMIYTLYMYRLFHNSLTPQKG